MRQAYQTALIAKFQIEYKTILIAIMRSKARAGEMFRRLSAAVATRAACTDSSGAWLRRSSFVEFSLSSPRLHLTLVAQSVG